MAIGTPEDLTVPKNDSAIATLRLTIPAQLVPVSPTNETHVVHYAPVSSVGPFLLASNVAVSRALCKVQQFSMDTLTSTVVRVSSRMGEAMKDVKATVEQLINVVYTVSIQDIDESSGLIAPELVGKENSYLMFDVALAFVLIMLGVQLQYKYG